MKKYLYYLMDSGLYFLTNSKMADLVKMEKTTLNFSLKPANSCKVLSFLDQCEHLENRNKSD